MSSRGKNFRRRAGDNDEEVDTPSTTTAAAAKPRSTTTTKPRPTSATTTRPLLSFADDEDGDEIHDVPPRAASKPKSSSHRITSSKDRITPPSAHSLQRPQAGTYTKEALLELQKNTKTLASKTRPSEPVLVLKGLFRPSIPDTVKERDEFDRKNKDDAEIRLASMGIGKGADEDEDGALIPNQDTINAIRAKREKLRQSRAAAPDFISLDGGSNHGEAEGLSDEEPEFRGRIAMFGDKKMESGIKGVFEDVDEVRIGSGFRTDVVNGEIEDEEEEEERKWEEEQFRKGIGKKLDDGSSRVVTTSSNVPVVHAVQQQNYAYPTAAMYSPAQTGMPSTSIGGAIGASQGFDAVSISQQAEIARKSMKENVMKLKETHGRTMLSLHKTEENLTASLLNITDLEKSLSDAGKKFEFMQELRDFVSVICDFLQHKAPFIEELAEQMQILHEERASAIIERRVADNEDEMKEIEAARTVLNRGGSTDVKEQIILPVKLDEFGRDMNQQKRMDMERRAAARKRRKIRSDSKRMSSIETDNVNQRVEGESSTDESDSEITGYQSNCELLLQTADQIFSDASEKYSQLSVVKEMFDKWKKNYLSTYRDAYMSLSVPAIFSPYVRLELLKWDPLQGQLDFDSMKWHSLLFDYGLTEDGFSPEDSDANLIPELVEKIALPILHHEITHCWDMLSTRETENAVSATSLVATYVPVTSEGFGELLVAIHTRLADAVANHMVLTWSPRDLKAVPNAARVAAYQFGTSVRLIRNICLWREILSMPVLENLALDELLGAKILPHLRSIKSNIHDAVTRTERIIASMSGLWAGSGVTGPRSKKLDPLVDFVLSLGKTLEKKQISGIGESETNGIGRRLKKMLVELNEYDQARAISRTFHLKEAL